MVLGIILTALLTITTLGATGNMDAPKYEETYERSIYDD